ncbi:monooxygenase flavin-binding family protein-like protein [Cryomyces antarcticus]
MAYEKDSTSRSYDVAIVGAGISGINAACRMKEQSPDRTFVILEARDAIGGTWDLFRYPGIRSDSDLYTFGFPFSPWTENRAIADGPSIKRYVTKTAATFGVDKHIKYRHKLLEANWSTDEQCWSLRVDVSGEDRYFHSRFVVFGTGYYDYNSALPATIPGIENFQGKVVHPQFWPEKLDYENKNIVVIGSGATAVTLLPNLAKTAAHVTMLQRSPTYVVSVPQRNSLTYWAPKLLPSNWTYNIIRAQFFLLQFLYFKFCKTFPTAARKGLRKHAAEQLPKGYPVEPAFQPSYNPWDQRLCISPNGDFYESLREGKADIVTGRIKQVTSAGILLEGSDTILHPDIIITATGLKFLWAGGAKIFVDNEPIDMTKKHVWKGVMIEDVPNAAIMMGYTNASWTLGADASAQFVTRLLNRMKSEAFSQAVPKVDKDTAIKDLPILNLSSTYVTEGKGDMPKAGDREPWLRQSFYPRDLWEARFGDITQDMHYTRLST